MQSSSLKPENFECLSAYALMVQCQSKFFQKVEHPSEKMIEEEDGVDFEFAFAADLSALGREYSTILDSCPVRTEESSFSHGIRAFSVRSLTNLLSPFEILIHD